MYSNRGQLGFADPDTGAAAHPPGVNAELAHRIDHHLLQRSHIRSNVALPLFQIENRVADNLPRADPTSPGVLTTVPCHFDGPRAGSPEQGLLDLVMGFLTVTHRV
jgi:hypothetical protein